MRGGIWGGSGCTQDEVKKIDGAFGDIGVAMPEWPPAIVRIRQGGVVGMLAKKVTVIMFSGCQVGGSRVQKAHVKIHGNQIPA